MCFFYATMLIRISEDLIRRSVKDKKEMKALALSFAVKALYKSSQLNNFTYSRIAEIFHISRISAKTRIEILRNMGLVFNNGNHLMFRTLREFGEGNKNINIQNYSSIDINNLKEVEKFLRLQGVFIKQSQIEYAVNVQKNILNPSSPQEYKKAKRKSKNIKHWNGETDLGQSINTVMKSSGLGRNSAIKILKWGEDKKLLTKKKRITKLFSAVGCEDNFKIPGNRARFFSCKGIVYSVLPTILMFLCVDVIN
jgi:hypothetical protein